MIIMTIINEISEYEGEQYFSIDKNVRQKHLREKRQVTLGSGNYDVSTTSTTTLVVCSVCS